MAPDGTQSPAQLPLGPGTRYPATVLRLRHSLRLVGEFGAYARVNRAWWLLMLVPLIVLGLLAIGTTQVVVPYTIYTLF